MNSSRLRGLARAGIRRLQAIKSRAKTKLAAAKTELHYRREQFRLRKRAFGFPIPSPKLNHLVTGTFNAEWYVESGRRAFEAIWQSLGRRAIDMGQIKDVLDFGCGSGRVIRYWAGQPARAAGSDYNPELIDWCKKAFPFARFAVNGLAPPLAFENESFDLVYALSVFTHLAEEKQFAWMKELLRVTRPGGYLFITLHGDCEFYMNMLPEEQKRRFRAGEMVVMLPEEEGKNCCNAFHPHEWVRRRLAAGLEVVDYSAFGAFGNPYQDVYLLRKPIAAAHRRAA